ncbi:hypothetical protein FS837_000291 [Tulasnella sp. UAMH 9824]|nr:hypothetical protein FS837_000291 [Tulasnella sp. UAMH 9824]
MDPPPWVAEDLPEENWHADSAFLEQLHADLRELAGIVMPDPILGSLERVVEAACDCGSRDGIESDSDDDMQDTYCPRRSNFNSDSNRTFLILEQMLPRLNFAAQKLSGLIEKVGQRAADSRNRWEAKLEYQLDRQQTRSTFDDLPAEVISSIASFASQTDIQALFALSRVNRHLRQLTLSTPLLWSELDVNDRIARNTIKLERATNVPLTVNLSLETCFSEDDVKAKLSRFATLIKPAHDRVRTLFVEPFDRKWLALAIDFIRNAGFQSLTFLRLGFQEYAEQYSIEDLAVTGQIQELRLERVLPANPASMFTHHTTRLELLDVVIPIKTLNDALISMPGLQYLTLINLNISDEENSAFAGVVLPHLRYLLVRYSAADIIIPLLETPSLETLHFSNARRWNPPRWLGDAGLELLIVIAKQNPQLRRLHVEEGCLEPDEWSEIFYNLSNLEQLHFKWCGIEGIHLLTLGGLGAETQESDDDQRRDLIACPKLQEIVFENELLLSSEEILKIVEARYAVPEGGNVRRISWITFHGCDADIITSEDIHAMAQLTRGIAADLIDGNDAFEKNSEDSYVESGDDCKFSDWELEETSSEEDDG